MPPTEDGCKEGRQPQGMERRRGDHEKRRTTHKGSGLFSLSVWVVSLTDGSSLVGGLFYSLVASHLPSPFLTPYDLSSPSPSPTMAHKRRGANLVVEVAFAASMVSDVRARAATSKLEYAWCKRKHGGVGLRSAVVDGCRSFLARGTGSFGMCGQFGWT